MTVYVVTTRPFGERKIEGVFEDRDQAIFCCALLVHDDSEMEEWDTNSMKFSGAKKPLAEWTVCVNGEGEAVDAACRYTFEEVCQYCEDIGGSWYACVTQPLSVSEEEVKEIVLDNIQILKEKAWREKSRNHKIT